MKFKEYITEAKRLTLKAPIKKKMNNEIRKITTPKNKTVYFKAIPLQPIVDVLEKYGATILQEDNTEWDGFLLGAAGTINFIMAPLDSKEGMFYTPYSNTRLNLQWYKMQSGKYEINCYVG